MMPLAKSVKEALPISKLLEVINKAREPQSSAKYYKVLS